MYYQQYPDCLNVLKSDCFKLLKLNFAQNRYFISDKNANMYPVKISIIRFLRFYDFESCSVMIYFCYF